MWLDIWLKGSATSTSRYWTIVFGWVNVKLMDYLWDLHILLFWEKSMLNVPWICSRCLTRFGTRAAIKRPWPTLQWRGLNTGMGSWETLSLNACFILCGGTEWLTSQLGLDLSSSLLSRARSLAAEHSKLSAHLASSFDGRIAKRVGELAPIANVLDEWDRANEVCPQCLIFFTLNGIFANGVALIFFLVYIRTQCLAFWPGHRSWAQIPGHRRFGDRQGCFADYIRELEKGPCPPSPFCSAPLPSRDTAWRRWRWGGTFRLRTPEDVYCILLSPRFSVQCY